MIDATITDVMFFPFDMDFDPTKHSNNNVNIEKVFKLQ
jgi:hypothetical protein